MKKVVLGLLILGQLGMAKENWYVIHEDMEEKTGVSQCRQVNEFNPITAENNGAEIKKVEDGVYILTHKIGDKQLNIVTHDSLKKCNVNRKKLINGNK